MNIYAWIGLGGILLLAPLSLLKEENRTKEEIRKVIITIAIVLGILIAVIGLGTNYLLALLMGYLVFIILDKKTYTKKRLTIYGSFILLIAIGGFWLLRDNPEYVLKHLKNNPQTTSLYVAQNGEEIITYQSNIVRPLASTVKIIIAAEYAMQIEEGLLNKNSPISIDDLNRHYFKGTDGGAHEAWLKMMNSGKKIDNNQVTLHDVAKGMITYSSNANTDYLIRLLGASNINERARTLELTQHEEVYPIVGALLIPTLIKTEEMNNKQTIQELRDMPMEKYRTLAAQLSDGLEGGTTQFRGANSDLTMGVQKVWSDRLIGASANDYGKLLAAITNDQFPSMANETLRDLLEWPMQQSGLNKERYTHLGSKGGSTAFILSDAVYAELLNGDKIEFVIMTDDLNLLESFLLNHNLGSFESKMLRNEGYRSAVRERLMGE